MTRRSAPYKIFLRTLGALFLVATSIFVQWLFLQPLTLHHPLLVFYPAVALAGVCFRLSGGVAATILAALAGYLLWLKPVGRFLLTDPEDQLYLLMFVVEGLVISYAVDRIRRAGGAEIKARIAEERQLADAHVKESEQRLRFALEGGQMGMWEWDLLSNQSKWNEKEYELLGLPVGEGEVSTDLFFQRVHPDDSAKLHSALEEVRQQGGDFIDELRIVRPDGEVRWLAAQGKLLRDQEGKPLRMLGVNFDITARKLAEEELRNREEEARSRANELAVLMDTVPAATFIAHDPECREMSASRKSRELLGIPDGKSVSVTAPEELRPDSFRMLKDGKELAPDEFPLQLAATGQEVRDLELTVLRKDGTSREIFGNAVPLFDEAGKVRGAIGAFLDVTERKRIQLELQKAYEELEKRVAQRTAELSSALESLKKETDERLEAMEALRESDQILIHQSRLASMGEMISNIAHQWRQPLNSMALLIQEMPVIYSTGEFSEEYLKAQVAKAKEIIFHMSQTIEDFRSFFSPSKEKLTFRASEMIAKTLSLVEDNLKKLEITVYLEEDGSPSIYGYQSECSQVLLNILMNARDAFAERAQEGAQFITIKAFAEGEKTVVTISDNAGGIPEGHMHRIFDPYFTTKGPDKGTGIGLFMAKKIIESHMNGRLTARNIEGGAEFRIELQGDVSERSSSK